MLADIIYESRKNIWLSKTKLPVIH